MEQTPWFLVWVAVAIALYHSYVQNPLEKRALAAWFPDASWLPRPECPSCLGMPSGHAEVAALLAVLLVVWARVPAWVAVAAVATVAWERVAVQEHTWLQVGIGALLGTAYGVWYTSSGTEAGVKAMTSMACVMALGVGLAGLSFFPQRV